MGFLIVFLGAGLGGMARHGVGLAALRFGTAFPYGTMGINILGLRPDGGAGGLVRHAGVAASP